MCAGRSQSNVEKFVMQLWSCYGGNALNLLATLLSFFHCGLELQGKKEGRDARVWGRRFRVHTSVVLCAYCFSI